MSPSNQKAKFRLNSFSVKDFSIKRKSEEQGEINLEITPTAIHYKRTNEFHLNLAVGLKDDSESFTIQLETIGIFNFDSEIEDKTLSNYFLTNAPALLFPYIRTYISAVTALSGLSTINLPVMNLSGLKSMLEENIEVIDEA